MGIEQINCGYTRITYPKKPNLIYLGMEYELHLGEKRLKDWCKTKGIDNKYSRWTGLYEYYYEHIHLKGKGYKYKYMPIHSDGGGVEFHFPASPIFYAKRVGKEFVKYYDGLFPDRSQNNYGGIHVHVSIKKNNNDKYWNENIAHPMALSVLHLLWENNKLFEKVSGRSVREHYNVFPRLRNLTKNHFTGRTYAHLQRASGITQIKPHLGTVENRIFKAHPDLIFPALEFTHSIFALALRYHEKGETGRFFTLEDYIKFLGNKKMYKSIKQRIEECA